MSLGDLFRGQDSLFGTRNPFSQMSGGLGGSPFTTLDSIAPSRNPFRTSAGGTGNPFAVPGGPFGGNNFVSQGMNLFGESESSPFKARFDGPPQGDNSEPLTFDDAVGYSDAEQFAGTYQWDDIIHRVSQESGVPVNVLRSIMAIESRGQNLEANSAGAVGLMQVVPHWWQETANQYGGDLMDPYINVRTAADILKMGYDQYGQDWANAAAFYFGGGGAFNEGGGYANVPDDFGTTIPVYVERFNENMQALETTTKWADVTGTPVGSAMDFAREYIGTPYLLGGYGFDAIDCSALTQISYGKAGIALPRTAQQQYGATQRVDPTQSQAGDLVFFHSTTPSSEYITHVGIYLGNGMMLHAGSNGVVIVSIENEYWQQHFAGFGRTG